MIYNSLANDSLINNILLIYQVQETNIKIVSEYSHYKYYNYVIMKIFVIFTSQLLCWVLCQSLQQFRFPLKCTQLSFVPMPRNITCDLSKKQQIEFKNPCSIRCYIVIPSAKVKQEWSHFQQLIDHQQYTTFNCRKASVNIITKESQPQSGDYYEVNIQIEEPQLASAFTTKQQSYSLNIHSGYALIKTGHYVGLVRALQTFLQSITCNKDYQRCYMLALPILIHDQPLFEYRGLLVDTSRHFIPMITLKETIDALMYNKMNIFHWHVVDQDSFPLELVSHPELAQYASFSIYETYSASDVRDFVHYAMVRGVRVIPQIDTPGHAASWASSPQNADIACRFKDNKGFKGPLDITLDKTYRIMRQVFQQIFMLFPDPLVHLGGDEVTLKCLQNKTQFLRLQNITEEQMEMQYRRKQKRMLKQINSTKVFMYWIYNLTKTPQIEEDDIMHWWGKTALLPPNINDRKIVTSHSTGPFYIDKGTGNTLGKRYYDYSTWLEIYRVNVGKEISYSEAKSNVLGAQLTLWSETNNMYTHHTKIWIRSSSMAQRLWTPDQHEAKPDFLRRLTTHQRLMNRRGIPTAPATCQLCQYHPEFC